jgi:hypothetical protein
MWTALPGIKQKPSSMEKYKHHIPLNNLPGAEISAWFFIRQSKLVYANLQVIKCFISFNTTLEGPCPNVRDQI